MEQEDLELEVSLGYVVRPFLKKKKKSQARKREKKKGKRRENGWEGGR
jgi:hypothetical protein